MKNIVLVLTNATDDSTNAVLSELGQIGAKFHRFDTETFPEEKVLQMTIRDGRLTGSLKDEERWETVVLEDIRSVWYRRPAPTWLSREMPSGYVKFIQGESQASLWSLYTMLDVFWMNPPLQANHLLQHNKMFQLQAASRVGLNVPESVITNDPAELLSFADRCGGTIAVKVLKGNFFNRGESIVPLFIFTQAVRTGDIKKRSAEVRCCPVLAQEYVPKQLEFRVTVVGNKVFACAIHSQDSEETRHDWRRYDFEKVKHEVYHLPSEVEEGLRRLMRFWNLSYGAVDMVLTPDGKYVFLELNPNGQWLWIENLTGMPISRAIAELLANPPHNAG